MCTCVCIRWRNMTRNCIVLRKSLGFVICFDYFLDSRHFELTTCEAFDNMTLSRWAAKKTKKKLLTRNPMFRSKISISGVQRPNIGNTTPRNPKKVVGIS